MARRYWLIFTVQVLVAGAGALVLGLLGAGGFILTWITLVVAAHFFPLATLLHDPVLRVLGSLLIGACALATLTHLADYASAASITSSAAGLLFAAAAVAKTRPRPAR